MKTNFKMKFRNLFINRNNNWQEYKQSQIMKLFYINYQGPKFEALRTQKKVVYSLLTWPK